MVSSGKLRARRKVPRRDSGPMRSQIALSTSSESTVGRKLRFLVGGPS